jgi:NLI interacting factor-like phosphatase
MNFLPERSAIRVGRKDILRRPGLKELFEFCSDNQFDVGIWSCMKLHNLEPQLQATLSTTEHQILKFTMDQDLVTDLSVDKSSTHKPVFVKNLQKIADLQQECNHYNIILVDDSPYKTCVNPFYSSFQGNIEDTFFVNVLIPFLAKLTCHETSLHTVVRQNYPVWSIHLLMHDYEKNESVWENPNVSEFGDPLHLKRYREHVKNIKVSVICFNCSKNV